MGKEYDLVKELGYGNWIDVVAGEAVLWGYSSLDPELEAKGAELARMVREIRFDSDQFYKVVASAKEVQTLIDLQKERSSAYIDKIFESELDTWPNNGWQYEFACIRSRYQIRITLPAFYADTELSEKDKMEQAVVMHYADPTFAKYRKEKKTGKSQFTKEGTWTEKYFDEKNILVREIFVHEHQDDSSRGFDEIFYLDDLEQGVSAWTGLRQAFISSRQGGIS